MTTEHSSQETAMAVLNELAQHPEASVRTIARALRVGRSTVCRAVARLVAEGRITIDRKGTGAGYPTRYRVAPP